jgi:hypothetical protein
MKKTIVILMIILGSMVITKAQSARELFLGKANNDKLVAPDKNEAGGRKGQSGAKVTIERSRDGRLEVVSTGDTFRAGDKIRLRFATNFDGYIRVLNIGSSGRVNLLYPYKGADDRITPSNDFQIPGNDSWIVFDDTPGTELVSVIMSSKPFSRDDREDLKGLNERATGGRDLFVQMDDKATFAVTEEENLQKPIGFTLRLKHGAKTPPTESAFTMETIGDLAWSLSTAYDDRDLGQLDDKLPYYKSIKISVEHSISGEFETETFKSLAAAERWLQSRESSFGPSRQTSTILRCRQGTCQYKEEGLLHNQLFLTKFSYFYKNGRVYISTIYLVDGD